MTIEVKCYVKTTDDSVDKCTIGVASFKKTIYIKQVTLEIHDKKFTVLANDLLIAIENAIKTS